MITAGSTARVMVTGSFGAFQGVNAQDSITQQLNNDGHSVINWTENDPTLISQLLEGDFLTRPYQVTLDIQLGQNYNAPSDLANEIGADFQQGLGSLPTAVAVTQINGVSTGQVQATNSYGLQNLTQGVGDALAPVVSKVETVLVVAVVAIVLILVFAPKSVKAIVG